MVLTVNGQAHELRIEPRVSLLDALREHLGLTGSKKGCDQGTCGACTVWVDGRRVLACLTLAVTCEGREVTTIEGLRPTASCIRCRRRSSSTTRSSAVTARPARSCRRSRCCEEGHAGDDAEIARVDERQHLPMRGVSRISGPRSARSGTRREVAVMRPFSYARAADADSAIATGPGAPGRRVPGRRHHRGRPGAAGRAAARRCWSTSTTCRWTGSRTCPAAGCGSARWPG